MLHFLDSLLAYLPATCSIYPVKRTRDEGTAQIFALALEKELVSLKQCVSELLSEEDEEWEKRNSTRNEETLETRSAEGLQRCREVWQRDVERSKMRLSPLVDVVRYRKLIQGMCEVQLKGDLAALLETQRTLVS